MHVVHVDQVQVGARDEASTKSKGTERKLVRLSLQQSEGMPENPEMVDDFHTLFTQGVAKLANISPTTFGFRVGVYL